MYFFLLTPTKAYIDKNPYTMNFIFDFINAQF